MSLPSRPELQQVRTRSACETLQWRLRVKWRRILEYAFRTPLWGCQTLVKRYDGFVSGRLRDLGQSVAFTAVCVGWDRRWLLIRLIVARYQLWLARYTFRASIWLAMIGGA